MNPPAPIRPEATPAPRPRFPWAGIALTAILLAAAALRLSGINWDENTHLHPDERFLTMVETALRIPAGVGEYFDTGRSPFNPHNANFGFFVYGTFPVFLVRLLAEGLSQVGYDQVHLVGRAAAAGFDLATLALLYALGKRLYGRGIALLAALLGAFTVLLIQHSHFFVVDPFANALVVAGLWFAVRAQQDGKLLDYALFGACVGAATASKISALPLAAMAVVVAAARFASAPRESREVEAQRAVAGLLLAGLVTFATFRVLQPYAFEGPSVFNILPNRAWLADLEEVRVQSSGDADLPFALQWADRPRFVFSLRNMVLWGMGLPLGLAAWAGWVWALVESLRGRWRQHLVPLAWTGGFALWQASAFTASMRYQLPVYPTLILFAAWGAIRLWQVVGNVPDPLRRWSRPLLGTVLTAMLGLHLAYGIGFASIYLRPVTRVAASRWIFANVPAAVNLLVEGQADGELYPLATASDFLLVEGRVHQADFVAEASGALTSIRLPRVSQLGAVDGPAGLRVEVVDSFGVIRGQAVRPLATLDSAADTLIYDPPAELEVGQPFQLRLTLDGTQAVALDGGLELRIDIGDGEFTQSLPLPENEVGLGIDRPLLVSFGPISPTLAGVALGWARPLDDSAATALTIELLDDPGSGSPVASLQGDISSAAGDILRFELPQPMSLDPDRSYWLRIRAAGGPVGVRGARLINESSWDDGLPLRMDGRDAFGGMYAGLNQELYWADDEDADGDGTVDKLERLVETLDRGDYLVITSNRQYGSIPRVPVRYPLTTEYYRQLFSCPEPKSVPVCGAVAVPDGSVSSLGFELVAVFQSNPGLGALQVNDQTAEEAFTVYDHPKVLIFRRTAAFSRSAVEAALGAVDVSRVQHVIPSQAAAANRDLLLPPERLAEQRAGGTWSELFPPESLINRSQVLATVAWWILILGLGWLALPIARRALPGFTVGAYAVSRILGMLLVAWGAWVLGSLRVPMRTPLLLAVVLALGVLSALVARSDRADFMDFLRKRRREIAWVEVLAVTLFVLDLAIRLGNPDLWHPSKGGEKPMDFSYFNAVLRSTSFPPYDPWFAGGYINYYYFGFVLVGTPVRLLGLNPAVAYNLILPTLFSVLGIAAFGLALEIARRVSGTARMRPAVAGLAAALGLVVLGNLGTVRMAYEGFKRIGTNGEPVHEMLAGIPQAVRGLGRFLSLQSPLPYRPDEWYWNPSRAIPSEPGDVDPITEFPFFTFLYADLHAHMISLPLTLLGLSWAVAWVLGAKEGRRPRGLRAVGALTVGGLILGSLRPTNTWDFPVYLGLGVAAAALAPVLEEGRIGKKGLLAGGLSAAGLLLAALVLYLPYTAWYVQGYTEAEAWTGSRTTIRAYLTVHGVFLFFLTAWMVHEAIDWMASTPLTALRKVRANLGWVTAAGVLLLTAGLYAALAGVRIVLVAGPLGVLAALLLFRRGQAAAKQVVLSLFLTALALTVVVEVVRLQGDIGRMNTVFKFYLQVWTLLAIAAGVALAWTWEALERWEPALALVWRLTGILLVAGAALYPLTATPAKIRDRMAPEAPRSLDGMAFLEDAIYYDQGGEVRLAEDLEAIRWLQRHVVGSPVIVEANVPEYRWGTRATIYTGLPGVLGWNWHQRQQRPLAAGDPVTGRALDLVDFYTTPSEDRALAFLAEYQVRYILVGGLERLYFDVIRPCWAADGGATVDCDMAGRPIGMRPPHVPAVECDPIDGDPQRLACPTHGLEKFEALAARGELREVFRQGQTVIYEVAP